MNGNAAECVCAGVCASILQKAVDESGAIVWQLNRPDFHCARDN